MTVAADDDNTLMLQVARGERAAFAVLFDRHQRSVVRFCERFVGNRGRAEELSQDIFINIYKSAARYRPDARFKTYLFRIATNHCLNETRRGEARRQVQEPRDMSDGPSILEQQPTTDSPERTLEGKQLEAVVSGAMQAMSERERAAFSMCRFEGMAYRDIAEALEATESAVKSLIHRATVQVMNHVEAFQQGISGPNRGQA